MEELREKVIARIDLEQEIEDKDVKNIIDDILTNDSTYKFRTITQKEALRMGVYSSIRGLDILEKYIKDDDISEIMVNGYQNIFIERRGVITKEKEGFFNKERYLNVIQRIVGKIDRRVNDSEPIVDARLVDGSRVNIVLNPIAIDGPVMTIRRFPSQPFRMSDLIKFKSLTQEVAQFLRELVCNKYSIFISGGTGSGKTTFLNILSNDIPKDERIITIEDSAELQINNIDNLVRLEARKANIQGRNEVTIKDLIKTSLRMRPDRIIIGEIRGEEALDMLQAMNTGHEGSISTGHANSCKDSLKRIETMVVSSTNIPILGVRSQIASAIDIIIQLQRMPDKTRKLVEIVEVIELKDNEIILNTIYKRQGGELNKVNEQKKRKHI